ncbi:quercetin 2,3-dioxygenase [Enterovibrio norvegicus]|uniref:pirin family protein n=1 Tax=Enterovibrio norvegicus TaxID=188144 RepID=UPI0002D917F2|nr:pirin family protein [Enterovibrio norvegicus]MCC4798609.1 pirin family protein [Enterovibrio norvegicus]OEE65183.1 quercetin 2,3-dioxygenase [Enterovibrio norvegicus]PMH67796.1 quercetin 2,3-dioxygenase [Enterovibrio norvegicus]PMI28750.1 quercetin 2,3-dioxygenase [Enterovibrio norvegicus]PMI36958.1 quercetin 2,3-dioxygenase [Enterovibrio norvegicus]
MTTRNVTRIIRSHASKDGDGVKINRVHGFNDAKFSPFLLIDELKSENPDDYIGGFPPHPHRGIETLTYMLTGHFQHRDHMGNVGELKTGGAQWMSAGKGVIHSEMPIMSEGGLHGFQIWINLPAAKKMNPAQYHDFQTEEINEYGTDKSLLRVISGNLTENGHALTGPLQKTGVEAVVADWRAVEKETRTLNVSERYQVNLFVYRGDIDVEGTLVPQGHFAQLSAGETISLTAQKEAGVLILAGEPINEPVVHYGPFVMNTMEEINQAMRDYENGVLTD